MGELTTPDRFHLRCPACNKLYIVATTDIANETPEFDCVSCHQRFFFNFPPSDFSNVRTIAIENLSQLESAFKKAEVNDASVHSIHRSEFVDGNSSLASSAQNFSKSVSSELLASDASANTSPKLAGQHEYQVNKSCPKCGALNDHASRECYSCHVIFEKLVGLPEDKSLRAQPSLVRKWRELAEDFGNEAKHEAFVSSCRQMDALKFAQAKYQDMRKALGTDDTCDKMLKQIETFISLTDRPDYLRKELEKSNATQRPTWMKYFFIGPFATSALMVLIGSLNLNHRNMIGGGFALAVCAAGLIMMVKGRISYDDFK